MTTILEDSLAFDRIVPVGRSPRLLLVAYNFPPVGGAGVQRPVKWVKNLRRLGWDVTVLTPENPSVPVRDQSLLADIPDNVLVARARTWEPDYRTKQGLVDRSDSAKPGIVARAKSTFKGIAKSVIKLALQPDPQILWVSNAIQRGKQILREHSHDAILVTAPPYSSLFVGAALKRRFGLPLVFDFRDEWDMSGKYLENAQRDWMSRSIQERMQRHLLRQADAVVATTKASTENLSDKLRKLNKTTTRTATVYNGFDDEDFSSTTYSDRDTSSCVNLCDSIIAKLGSDEINQNEPSKFRIVYTGTLWNLTTIEPFVDAVCRLNQSSPDLVSKLEFVCVGRKTAEQTVILERLRQTKCRLNLIDYCEHSKVLDWLRSTDAVCLLLSDVAGAERVVPAKLFEYLANRKDMLSIVPRGETADIVRRYFPTGLFEPKDVDGIVGWLKRRLSGDVDNQSNSHYQQDFNEYSRFRQTQRLVELLNELVPNRFVGRGALS